MDEKRIEQDSFGKIKVPNQWGAQTQRSIKISLLELKTALRNC